MQSVLSHTPKSYIGQVPADAQRNGDFSQGYYNAGQAALQVIYYPLTVTYNAQSGAYARQPFLGNNEVPLRLLLPEAAVNLGTGRCDSVPPGWRGTAFDKLPESELTHEFF